MGFIWDSSVEFLKDRKLDSSTFLTAVVLLSIAVSASYLLQRSKRLDFPRLEVSSTKNYRQAISDAVAKYPNTPFIIPFQPEIVILPMSTLEELKNLPESQVSFEQETKAMFHHRHTGIGAINAPLIKTVKIDLTRQVAASLDALSDEVQYAFDKELGPCNDWTPVTLYPTLARIVAILSGRVFVGRPLSRQEDWINSMINYAMDAEATRQRVAQYPPILRHFVVPFLPEVKSLKRHRIQGAKFLEPILRSIMKADFKEKLFVDESQDQQGSILTWLLDNYRADRLKVTADEMADNQMAQVGFAAIHTSTMAATHVIFDLAARPEYVQPLRDEIHQVIQEDGYDKDDDGNLKLKKTSLTKLRKLDSFLKESQRLSPPSFITNLRLTMSPLTLSTGHKIPKHTRIGYASHPVHMSPLTETFSPEYNPSTTLPPSEFDGFRFSNLRAMAGKENKHQFVTTSSESLNFGHGQHACPGRFFASNEIKLVLIELLRHWDLRLKGGATGEEARPKSYDNDMTVIPNMTGQVEFKRRSQAPA